MPTGFLQLSITAKNEASETADPLMHAAAQQLASPTDEGATMANNNEAFETAHPLTHAAAQQLQQLASPTDEGAALKIIALELSADDAWATPDDQISLLMLAAAAGAAQCARARSTHSPPA